ncbi:MAG: GNAT family N-acetyltransferase [Acutalibacter sp.]|jgi:ribosomal protein S18 acetylase RimI-like enzyme
MELTVRRASLADAPALTRLNREEMGYDYPEEKTVKRLETLLGDPTHCILVAESQGRVVGYLHLEWYELLYSDPMVNVMGIATASACRRQGVGRALLAAGEEWAKSQGASAVRLVSGESRKGAHAFYQRLGFTGNKLQRNFKKPL